MLIARYTALILENTFGRELRDPHDGAGRRRARPTLLGVGQVTEDRNSGSATVRSRRPGTFQPGNPGRRPGVRNRATMAAMALLEGETEAITRKAVELAKAGDTVALKLVLERLLPRSRAVKI